MSTNEVFSGWAARYQSEPKGIRAGWLNLLGDRPLFPRDLVFPIPGGPKGASRYQKSMDNVQAYYRILEENAPKADCWAGWSPSAQYDLQGMERVFGDIDSPDLEDALIRARRFENGCLVDFGVQPVPIFTAGKGFHLHFTHDFVDVPNLGVEPGAGTAYSDAFASLTQHWGANPDLGTLKHRKTYPRVPYSMNLKATGKHRKPMYVVPVDLTWSLKEILKASSEIRVTPFKIPHSSDAADMLRPQVAKAAENLKSFQALSGDVQKGIHEDLVQAAIAFCETVGWKLVNEQGKPDGRRRLITQLYAPALMMSTDGERESVIESCRLLLEMMGGEWPDYRRFVESTVKECVGRDSVLRSPIGLKRWWAENSDLRVGA